MAQVTVTLTRERGSDEARASDEECKRFLWCLGRRLEASPRDEPAEPTPEDLEKVVPLQVVDFTVEAEDLEAARKVVLDAAVLCVDNPFGLYSFRAGERLEHRAGVVLLQDNGDLSFFWTQQAETALDLSDLTAIGNADLN